jgi:hypothetical protein
LLDALYSLKRLVKSVFAKALVLDLLKFFGQFIETDVSLPSKRTVHLRVPLLLQLLRNHHRQGIAPVPGLYRERTDRALSTTAIARPDI